MVCLGFFARPLLAQVSPATLPDVQFTTPGIVLAVALQDDGQVILGGSFSSVNGAARANIARVNANGAVDASWNPGANNAVRQIVVDGTNVFVLGDFTVIGGQTRDGIAKLSVAGSGDADPQWNPEHPGNLHALAVSGMNLFVGGLSYLGRLSTLGTGMGESPWGPQPDVNIFALAVRGDDLYVGGNFSQIGGITRGRLAKVSLLGAGAVDPAWHPDAAGGRLGAVKTLFATDTYLYVGGSFDQVGGQNRKNIARVDISSAGEPDPIWDPGADPESVYALVAGNGGVYVGGSFSQIGGLPRPGLAKVSDSGLGAADPSWNTESDGSLVAALALDGGAVFAGGGFARVHGVVSLSLAKLDAVTGARVDTFAAQVGQPGTVQAVARQSDGKVVVGGEFALVGGGPCRNLARFDASGVPDTTWRPDPDGRVTAIAIDGEAVFVAGEFTQVGGQSRRFLAKLSATGTDQADPAWNPDLSSPVDALAVDATNVFVAGRPLGNATLLKLSALAPGQAEPAWNPGQFLCDSCPSLSAVVRALAADASGVYVAGEFDGVVQGANYLARNGLVKLSATGAGLADGQWNPAPDGAVHSLVLDGTNVYVAGSFSLIGGQSRNGLARVSSAGAGETDPGWDPGLIMGDVEVLALSGTNLYAAGSLGTASGLVHAPLARLATTGSGSIDPDWDPRPQLTDLALGRVAGLAARGTDVYVVGDFDAIGGASRSGFAFLPVADAPRIIEGPSGVMILRNAEDGSEVTHFRISALDGVALFRNDGETPVLANEFITVEDGSAGLRYTGSGTITAVAALNDTPAGAGTAATTVNLDPPAPRFTHESFSGDGQFQFVFSGQPGFRSVVEASADLFTWIAISTNVTDTAGTLEFVDAPPGQDARRFYRVRQTGPQ